MRLEVSLAIPWYISDPVFQLRSMQLVSSLYPWGQISAIQAGVASLPGQPLVARLGPRSGPVPPFVLARLGNTYGLFVTGITTAQDGLGLYVSGSSVAVTYKGVKLPLMTLEGAKRLKNLLAESGVGREDRVVLIGHSYGAALALVLGWLLRTESGMNDVNVLGFGGPRPGDSSLAAAIGDFPTLRIMCEGDPVPRFPPHQNEAPAAYGILPTPVTYWWSQWEQAGPGLVLDEGGAVRKASLPALILPIQDVNLLHWATSPYGFSSARHAGYHYVRRLAQRVAMIAPAEPFHALDPDRLPKIDLQFTTTPAVGTLTAVKAVITAIGVADMRGTVPVDYLAKYQRVGDDYCIIWRGRIVAKGISRSNAGTMAARLNAWLRRLVACKYVYTGSLVESLQEFLAAASTGGGGFSGDVIVSP